MENNKESWQEFVRNYIKKPVEVQAIQFDDANHQEILDWIHFCGGRAVYNEFRKTIAISTIDSTGYVGVGDYVVRGTRGEFYPCAGHVFDNVYHEVPPEYTDD